MKDEPLIPSPDPDLHLVPCPAPLEGGMCGCDEPEETCPEGVCLMSECDC